LAGWLLLPALSAALAGQPCSSGAQLHQRQAAVAAYRQLLPRHPGRRQLADLRRLKRRVAACRLPPPPPAPTSGAAQPFPFFPQAGILWQDLFVYNFVDLDPGGGTLDWSCSHQTYDTHTGEDSIIRSFREQAIGVPVFAALDGRVTEVQGPNWPDDSWGTDTRPNDNHVVIAHANRQETVYGHLKRGSISVRVGERVLAGQQIGLTGSSGNSSGPHLHFTARWRGDVYEPFAGPCRAGASGWANQVPLRTEPYVRDFHFSSRPFMRRAALPWDQGPRTGSFTRGAHDVWFRLELGNELGGPLTAELVRPDGSVAASEALALQGAPRAPAAAGHLRVGLNMLGRWRLRVGSLLDAPLDVVRGKPRNRTPNPLGGIELSPATPAANEVVFCLVRTSLVTEDPDFDLVRYRYRWLVDGRPFRTVRSAALSDAIPRATALPGQRLTCRVTPTDGRLAGPTATVTAVVR
jgi:Peptidase family M23